MKAVVEWISLLMIAVALGLGAAAAPDALRIPRTTMDLVLISIVGVALVIAAFTWRRYARSLEDDDSADL